MNLSDYYFNETEEIICGTKIPSIVNDYIANPPTVVDRFFQKYYYSKEGTGEDYQLLFHSNGICLICLAPTHIALTKGIASIIYNIGNFDRSLNKVKGKSKGGAMPLQEGTALAHIACNDGSLYKIRSCFKAKLIEMNDRLLSNLDLIKKEGDGYIAIVMPKRENISAIKSSLISYDEYRKKNSPN